MDAKPFFEFDLRSFRDGDLDELKKFSKSTYDLQGILTTASELKYTKEILAILGSQLLEPTDDFVRLFTTRVYDGKITQQTRERFSKLVQRAFRLFINDQINDRLKSALGADAGVKSPEPDLVSGAPSGKAASASPAPTLDIPTVVTTQEEWEAFFTIRALLHSAVLSHRVFLRDVQTYCGVLLDDNNRKPICRLYLNTGKKAIGIFDGEGRTEQRVSITKIDDIHEHAERLRAAALSYETARSPSTAS
jgi:hypothetical protein